MVGVPLDIRLLPEQVAPAMVAAAAAVGVVAVVAADSAVAAVFGGRCLMRSRRVATSTLMIALTSVVLAAGLAAGVPVC